MNTHNSNSKCRNYFFSMSFSLLFLIYFCNAANSSVINITVGDYAFSPSGVTVAVGDTIHWIWKGPGTRTSTCDGIYPHTSLPNGAVSWDVTFSSSTPFFDYVIPKIGIYNYVSKIDPLEMSGSITAESTLPVELTDFVATTIKNEVILDWSTTGEINNDKFEVQRIDVTNFTDFDPNKIEFTTVGVLRGNGTSNQAHHYRFIDKNLETGKYLYRLKQLDYNSNYIYHLLRDEIIIGLPDKFTVEQNYPNPFNPSTKINYELPESGNVKVSVFDSEGKEVLKLVNEYQSAGYKTLQFNGANLSSGVYFYTVILNSGQDKRSVTKKMVLAK